MAKKLTEKELREVVGYFSATDYLLERRDLWSDFIDWYQEKKMKDYQAQQKALSKLQERI